MRLRANECECEEGQRQSEGEQDQECPDSLGWNAISEQARWHVSLERGEIPIGLEFFGFVARCLGRPSATAEYRENGSVPAFWLRMWTD